MRGKLLNYNLSCNHAFCKKDIFSILAIKEMDTSNWTTKQPPAPLLTYYLSALIGHRMVVRVGFNPRPVVVWYNATWWWEGYFSPPRISPTTGRTYEIQTAFNSPVKTFDEKRIS